MPRHERHRHRAPRDISWANVAYYTAMCVLAVAAAVLILTGMVGP